LQKTMFLEKKISSFFLLAAIFR
jgi:hypothetical protein